MRLAIIGDLHHYRTKVPARRLIGRRAIGQTNLWLNRRFAFRHALLAPVIDKVSQINPDMILLTGDVTTTSLEDEFLDVAAFLKPLSDRFATRLVPGNHDRYTRGAVRRRRVENLMAHLMPPSFPHFEKISERWRLLTLDGARPSNMLSQGRLGRAQLQQAAQSFRELSADDGVVVLCHYPVVWPDHAPPIPWNTRLPDGYLLRRLLRNCPARIVYVHGHIHRPWFWSPMQGRFESMTFLNAGAPCLPTARYPDGQGFWQLDLPEDPREPLHALHHVPVIPRPAGFRRKSRKRLRQLNELQWQAREHLAIATDPVLAA